MEAVGGEVDGIAADAPADGGDLDVALAETLRLLAIHGVVGIQLQRDASAITALGEGRDAPVWDGQDEDAPRVASGEGPRSLEQPHELGAVAVDWSPAVLVVDADEQ